MAIVRVIRARERDTLCGIAVDNGFRDCRKLRDANPPLQTRALRAGDTVNVPDVTPKVETGQTEVLHRFRRPGRPVASVRFVHGSRFLAFKDDPTLTELNVSNYRTDQAGADRKQPFATDAHGTFDANADADNDTFKLEVLDPRAKTPTVQVELDVKRPTYNAAGKLTGHTDFPGTRSDKTSERGRRSLDARAEKMGSTQRFRTCYLRAVVDPEDQSVRPTQTLLTTHMVDSTPPDEKVEILDQVVVGSYKVNGCPVASPDAKCRVSTEIPVCAEPRQKRVKVRVHILRPTRTGAGVVAPDQARKGCLARIRELYAQAHTSVRLLEEPRLVPPPSNMFAIADGNGRSSLGGSKMKVRVQIDATVDQTVEIDTDPGHPIVNATKLANAIAAAVGPGVRVRASENRPLIGQAIGSADVVVGDPLTQDIRLTVLTSGDARHPLQVARTTSAQLGSEFGGNDAHVGTIHERVLLKNYDTGSDHVDLVIIDSFPPGSGTLGEAFIPNLTRAANRQPIDTIVNSAIVLRRPFSNRNTFHTTVPHEIGHILMDANHATETTEMMTNGSPVGSNERVVNGPKRISDPAAAANNISYDDGNRGNPTDMLRNRNRRVLEGW
jgi:hypothetical protein